MSRARLAAILAAAQAEGLLPAQASMPVRDSRPWPMVLLTALGVWLATVPLFIVPFGMLDAARNSHSLAALAALQLVGAIAVLRCKAVPLFVEQLAVATLVIGVCAIHWMLEHQLGIQRASTVLCALLLVLAVPIPKNGLRVLLGAAAAVAAGVASMGASASYHPSALPPTWLVLHLLLVPVWGLAALLRNTLPSGARARTAAIAETVGTGWLLATLIGLAWWAGLPFLMGDSVSTALLNEVLEEILRLGGDAPLLGARHAVSAVLALLGGAWLGTRWAALRQAWCVGGVLVLSALAAMMPTLGACLLVLALCAGTWRWHLAAVAAVAAVWIIGAFCYALHWPLATKAAALMGVAALLAALGLWGFLSQQGALTGVEEAAEPEPSPRAVRPLRQGAAQWGVALGAVVIVLAATASIWQKEQLIRHGQAIFVPLAPVLPTFAVQGDFIALNFLPRPSTPTLNSAREVFHFDAPREVFKRDAQGIVTLLGPDEGKALNADEIAIQLVQKNGHWILVTDAFFFAHGEVKRWSAARYGEFRVDASGKALLLGLRGEDLKPL